MNGCMARAMESRVFSPRRSSLSSKTVIPKSRYRKPRKRNYKNQNLRNRKPTNQKPRSKKHPFRGLVSTGQHIRVDPTSAWIQSLLRISINSKSPINPTWNSPGLIPIHFPVIIIVVTVIFCCHFETKQEQLKNYFVRFEGRLLGNSR